LRHFLVILIIFSQAIMTPLELRGFVMIASIQKRELLT